MPVFFPKTFIVLGLTFRPLIHFELIFGVWREVGFPAPFAEKTNSPPLPRVGTLVDNQLTINICVYFWTFNSTPLLYLSILLSVLHNLDYCGLVLSFKIRRCEHSSLLLPLQEHFLYSGSHAFADEFEDHLVNFCTEGNRDFDRD